VPRNPIYKRAFVTIILCGYIKYNVPAEHFGDVMIKRGELYYADLSPVVGSEQGGIRPVLIVQNDTGNKYSPTIIAAAITSQLNKARLPTHIEISARDFGLSKDSVILLEQIRTLDKKRLKERIGELTPVTMKKVNVALLISLGFGDKLTEAQNDGKSII